PGYSNGHDTRGGAVAPFELVTDHTGPAADASLLNCAAVRGIERVPDVLGFNMEPINVVEPAVPRLRNNRQAPPVAGRIRCAVFPTATPETSVMELNLPAVPSNGIPRSRARTTFAWVLGGGGDLIGSRAEAAITRANRNKTIAFISLSIFPRQRFSIRLFPADGSTTSRFSFSDQR